MVHKHPVLLQYFVRLGRTAGVRASRVQLCPSRKMSSKHPSPDSESISRKEPRIGFLPQILFEDNEIIVIDKVPNEASVPQKGSRPVQTTPKKRTDEWVDAVRLAASLESNRSDSLINEPLKLISEQHSIPRKEQKFYNFLTRSVKIDDPVIQKRIWNIVNEVDVTMNKQPFSEIPKHLISSADRVEQYCGHKIYHVHRLDMETSGVLMYAKTENSCAELCRQFRDREVKKMYLARVAHRMMPLGSSQTISLPICVDYENRPRQIVDHKNGKESTTIAEALVHVDIIDPQVDNAQSSTIVKLHPITGRTHQLRIHLSAIGHPILGDTLYASPEIIAMSPDRLCLHAHTLQFTHPETKEPMTIRSNGCDFIPDKYNGYLQG